MRCLLEQEKFSTSQYPNLRFEAKDAQQLDYKNAFNRIFSFSCLHWAENHHAVLKGMFESLKPGGSITLSMLSDKGPVFVDSIAMMEPYSSCFSGEIAPWIYLQNSEKYEELLNRVSFSEISCIVLDKIYSYPSMEHIIRSFDACLPHTKVLPKNLRGSFLKKILDNMVEQNWVWQQHDGSVERRLKFLFITAQKKGQ